MTRGDKPPQPWPRGSSGSSLLDREVGALLFQQCHILPVPVSMLGWGSDPSAGGTDPSAGDTRSQGRGHQIPGQWPHSSQPSLPPAGTQGILWPSAPPEKCHRCHSLSPESRGQAQTSAAQSGLFRPLLNSSEDFLAGSQSSGKI